MKGILNHNKYKELIKNITLDKSKCKAKDNKDIITEVKYNNISGDKIYEKIKNIYEKIISFQRDNKIMKKKKLQIYKNQSNLYIY